MAFERYETRKKRNSSEFSVCRSKPEMWKEIPKKSFMR